MIKKWINQKIKHWEKRYKKEYSNLSSDDDAATIEQQGFTWGYLEALKRVKEKLNE
jgi:hypothetical protein